MTNKEVYNEQKLLLQVADGDEQAFRTVFEHLYPSVYKAALLVTASRDLAEEVVQDVFLKIWLKRKELPAVSNLKGYIFIIARNQAYKAFIKQQKWHDLTRRGLSEEDIHLLDIDEQLEKEKMLAIYEAAVNRLPDRQQQVYRLSKQQGYSREQIAMAMNISPETVKKYLALAIMSIRAYCLSHAPELLPAIFILCHIHL